MIVDGICIFTFSSSIVHSGNFYQCQTQKLHAVYDLLCHQITHAACTMPRQTVGYIEHRHTYSFVISQANYFEVYRGTSASQEKYEL